MLFEQYFNCGQLCRCCMELYLADSWSCRTEQRVDDYFWLIMRIFKMQWNLEWNALVWIPKLGEILRCLEMFVSKFEACLFRWILPWNRIDNNCYLTQLYNWEWYEVVCSGLDYFTIFIGCLVERPYGAWPFRWTLKF